MVKSTRQPIKYCFILVQGRKKNHIKGAVYWCHYGKSTYNVYMSNRKGFVHNLSKGFCTFNTTQINHLYNYIRKHCGYRSLKVTKLSKVALNTVKKDLRK